MLRRMSALIISFAFLFSMLIAQIFFINTNGRYLEASVSQSSYTITAGSTNANIYDCNMVSFTNTELEHIAVINPTAEAVAKAMPFAEDKALFSAKLKSKKPFTCRVTSDDISSNDIIVFDIPKRLSSAQSAQHIIGYTRDGIGITGLEQAYNSFLRSFRSKSSVTFCIDNKGYVLNGADKKIIKEDITRAGIVTTLDSRIQAIAEDAMKNISKGAAIVMDVGSGELRAVVSMPSYNAQRLTDALKSSDAPLINRAFCSYSAGSIFKLVICAAALENGFPETFEHCCTGSTTISGKSFKCHKSDGHGMQNMEQAVQSSCNTYFVKLSEYIDSHVLYNTAAKLGFGSSCILADTISSSAGRLTSANELEIAAEKANFSFGQGMLTVTPLQIAMLTCAIANNGDMPIASLVKGLTHDGVTLENRSDAKYAKSISSETAQMLQKFMLSAVDGSSSSKARSRMVTIAGKTSTAQTGRYDEDATELCHGWITGFFPYEAPEYAVTVIAEDGGTGNTIAAPVLKDIAQRISALE